MNVGLVVVLRKMLIPRDVVKTFFSATSDNQKSQTSKNRTAFAQAFITQSIAKMELLNGSTYRLLFCSVC